LLLWGGIASMAGGALWALLLLKLSDLPYADWIPFDYGQAVERLLSIIPIQSDPRLFAAALLLFIVGLVGLYTKQWSAFGSLSRIGFSLSFLGMGLSAMSTIYPLWLYVIHRYVAYNGAYFEGLFPFSRVRVWLGDTWFELVIMSVGLTLVGIAAIRAKSLPTRVMTFFIFAASGLLLVPTLIYIIANAAADLLRLDYYQISSILYDADPFMIMALVFGFSWIILGYQLLLSSADPAFSPHAQAAAQPHDGKV
jgi:hypothetical protein